MHCKKFYLTVILISTSFAITALICTLTNTALAARTSISGGTKRKQPSSFKQTKTDVKKQRLQRIQELEAEIEKLNELERKFTDQITTQPSILGDPLTVENSSLALPIGSDTSPMDTSESTLAGPAVLALQTSDRTSKPSLRSTVFKLLIEEKKELTPQELLEAVQAKIPSAEVPTLRAIIHSLREEGYNINHLVANKHNQKYKFKGTMTERRLQRRNRYLEEKVHSLIKQNLTYKTNEIEERIKREYPQFIRESIERVQRERESSEGSKLNTPTTITGLNDTGKAQEPATQVTKTPDQQPTKTTTQQPSIRDTIRDLIVVKKMKLNPAELLAAVQKVIPGATPAVIRAAMSALRKKYPISKVASKHPEKKYRYIEDTEKTRAGKFASSLEDAIRGLINKYPDVTTEQLIVKVQEDNPQWSVTNLIDNLKNNNSLRGESGNWTVLDQK